MRPFTTLITELTADQPQTVPQAGTPQSRTSTLDIGGDLGIPKTVLDAYHRGENTVKQQSPGCQLSWTLLAAIGKVESGHADQGNVTASGDMLDPIFGPTLNGADNTAAIRSAGGDWARAAGPMQMIPSTWRQWAADGNEDGRADPQNVYDASLSAGRYLCANGRNLGTQQGEQQAILNYNPSATYYQLVARWVRAYQGGASTLPDEPGALDPDTRAHRGRPSGPTNPPPTDPASDEQPVTDQPASEPTPKPEPKPTPSSDPKPAPFPAPALPRLVPPPADKLLPAPLGAAPRPKLSPAIDGVTNTLGLHK